MKNRKYPIFNKAISGITVILSLSILLLTRGEKNKNEFLYTDGKITYLGKTYQELPFRHEGKYRYLKVEGFPKIFEIFVGKDAGDFAPKYERLDELSVGDGITVYYDINDKEKDVRVNRVVRFIDKGNEPFFIEGGNIDKYLGAGGISFALISFVGLFYLKRSGRII